MIKLTKLSIRNFMSFGNVPQVLDLSEFPMTLIQGINRDKTDNEPESETDIENASASLSEKPSNGSGKSSILSALNYVIFGESIANKIKKSNLVNKINKKNLEVSLEFEKDGTQYRIERGRSPEYLRFFVNGEDLAQGENKDTQEDINKAIGMSPDLFYQICLMTASAPTFMEMNAAGQREIIEQLLGVQILTDKAEKLKEKVKEVKQIIATEEVRLATVKSANDEIIKRNEIQKADYQNKLNEYEANRNKKVEEYEKGYKVLAEVDIEKEIENHKFNESVNQIIADNAKITSDKNENIKKLDSLNINLTNIKNSLESLSKINIEEEIKKHKEIESIQEKNKEVSTKILEESNKLNDVDRQLIEVSHTLTNLAQQNIGITNETKQLNEKIESENKIIKDNEENLKKIENNTCPTCGAKLTGENTKLSEKYNESIKVSNEKISGFRNQITENDNKLKEIKDRIDVQKKLESSITENKTTISKGITELQGKIIKDLPSVYYKDIKDVYEHQNKINLLNSEIEKTNKDIEEINKVIAGLVVKPVPEKVKTFYETMQQAMVHSETMKNMQEQIDKIKKEENPYTELLKKCEKVELMPYDESLKKSSEDDLNHLDFLVKLLTNKDSFVRKKIVEQNLAYLNLKIKNYLQMMGSLHVVIFNPDLSFDITKFGESFDFAGLSRGEKTSVILALNFAFRDLYELINEPINVMFVDELIDNGLDKYSASNVISILQKYSEQNKNIFVVSHRKDIQARMNRILTVVMELGFSEIQGLK